MASKPDRAEEPHLRIALVGKTGVGKSAVGNTILEKHGQNKVFKSTTSASSVTAKCKKENYQFNGQLLAVVDTPGLFDTQRNQKEVMTEIAKCISFVAPGPHVFLVVVRAARFTEEEHETVKILQQMFGKEAAGYTLALFTCGDNLEADGITIDELIKENLNLRTFISQCGGGYHVFNNRSRDPAQVRELLEKINSMVQRNGGSYYSTEMFRQAEEAIQKEMGRLHINNPGMTPEEVREKAEEDNSFIQYIFGSLITIVEATVKKACSIQ